jgi:dienelactone hydrolase
MNIVPKRASLWGAASLIALSAASLSAQGMRFLFPAPAPGSVTVTSNVQYGTLDTATLRMDVYRPAGVNAPAPALIFFNQAVGPERTNDFYVGWARAAASKGLIAIVPDLHGGAGSARDFQRLIAHLSEQAATYGIDRDAIAVYAGSGNVFTAFPVVEDPKQTLVKAAVMYYGTAPITEFRRDLPVLYVRAGLDRPGVNGNATSGITRLAALAISQNAPITVINHPIGHHAFEIVDDDAATRDVIDRTIDFVKRATAAPYQAALRRALPEAAAAAHVITGDFGAAAAEYANVLASRPDDIRLRLSYGEALLGDKQYAAACGEFYRLQGKGLGARDLGLPAARACLLKGDSAAAVGWLQTIPKRFLPPSLQQDTAFAGLRSRADFRALFQPLNH